MSVRTATYYTCDVCTTVYYSESSITEITFSYDGKSHKFDCCYGCFRGNEKMRTVYKKIINWVMFWRNSKSEEV